jgi:hypothetical protein
MDRSELSQVPSPSGKVVAVLIEESGGGAAGSRVLGIFLAKTTNGEAVESQELDDPVMRASSCEIRKLHWIDGRTLAIEYDAGCNIFEFKSYWHSESSRNSGHANLESVELVPIRKAKVDDAW